jgi:hypothetical protein
MKLSDLPPDNEFVIADKLGDGVRRDELRLTFYNKVRDLDPKRVEVELFGCIQIVLECPFREDSFPLDEEAIGRVKLGQLLILPRYNNLNDFRTSPMPMSGAYVACATEARATLMRLFYRDVRRGDPAALAQLAEAS